MRRPLVAADPDALHTGWPVAHLSTLSARGVKPTDLHGQHLLRVHRPVDMIQHLGPGTQHGLLL